MINNKDFIEEAIKIAQDASASAEPNLRANAFEVVLAHLLNAGVSASPQHKAIDKMIATDIQEESRTTAFDVNRLAAQLGITAEQAEDLYEFKGDCLLLRIKPSGKKTPEQRRVLAEVLMVGYKFGLNTKTVAQSKILKAADEWNLGGNHFSRDVGKSKWVHGKAGGKGFDPLLALAPGSIEEISATIKSLLNLE
jgi:hypothetical protein